MKANPGTSLADVSAAALLAIGSFLEGSARHRRAWLAAIPVIGVNAVAFYGQLAYLDDHLPAPPGIRVLVALTLESVAIYLAWQAHLALLANDSAFRIRLAAYSFAAVIGVMNYSHWMGPHWRPTFAAVAFGLMSVISPWLWSVHSRRASRDQLKEQGLIDSHAVRLGTTRWFWHMYRSFRVMWLATWVAETDPAAAIALIGLPRQDRRQPENPGTAAVPAGNVADAAAVSAPDSPAAAAPPPVPLPQVEPRRAVKACEASQPAGLAAAPRAAGHALPPEPPPGEPPPAPFIPRLPSPELHDGCRDDHERAVLARLLAADGPLPSDRELSRAEWGSERCQPAIRVLKLARAEIASQGRLYAVNGSAHG